MKKVLYFVLAVICLWACEKTPEEIAVTSVSLSQSTAEMIEGETAQLIATVLPADATDKKVIWASSKESVASVSNTGLVLALAEGTSTITASVGGKSSTCIVTVIKKAIEVSSVKLNKESLVLVEGDSETLIATVLPENATDKTVTWDSSQKDIAIVDVGGQVIGIMEGTAIISAKAGDKTSECIITVIKEVPAGAVDLGIVMTREDGSSYILYWAKSNLSEGGLCANPEDYGDYYAWGETEKKDNYDYTWESYKWANGEYGKLIKYCPINQVGYWDGEGSPDNKTTLDKEDDVAQKVLGSNWRIPTKEEWVALQEQCSWSWVSNYVAGINGVVIRSKVPGNTNSIFLPAGDIMPVGNHGSSSAFITGYYWSSSINETAAVFAREMTIIPSRFVLGSAYRSEGLSVRPVTE